MKGASEARLLVELDRRGLLLESDPRRPSVAGLVAGERIRGTWWAHPRSHEIYARLERLADHKDVLRSKLVSGKVTLVHRRLWPALLGVAKSGEAWQTEGLPALARALAARVTREGSVRTDRLHWKNAGELARELERRLLVHGESVHTESGAHAKVLETWERWAERSGAGRPLPLPDAKRRLEEAVEALGGGDLPWARASLASTTPSASRRPAPRKPSGLRRAPPIPRRTRRP